MLVKLGLIFPDRGEFDGNDNDGDDNDNVVDKAHMMERQEQTGQAGSIHGLISEGQLFLVN